VTEEIILERRPASGGDWQICGDQEGAWLDLSDHYDDYGNTLHGLNEGLQFEAGEFVYRKFRVIESLVLF